MKFIWSKSVVKGQIEELEEKFIEFYLWERMKQWQRSKDLLGNQGVCSRS